MGWTVHYDVPRDIKAEIIKIIAPWEPVQISKVGSVWYVAGRKGDEVVAFIISTSIKNGEWGYNDMDETEGPCETKAPKSLIAKLTPTDRPYAIKWRQECLDYANRPKFKVGDKIRLAHPANFGPDKQFTDFTVSEYQARRQTRRCFYHPVIGLCRLSSHALEGASLCPPTA